MRPTLKRTPGLYWPEKIEKWGLHTSYALFFFVRPLPCIRLGLSLVLICCRATCDTVPIWETKLPATEARAAFTAGMPAKLKTSDVSCCRRRYVLIRRRSIAGSTGGYVAGTSVAYENHAGMPAVKTSDVSCCRRRYVLIRRRSIAGSTGGYVAGTSVAYENQALQWNLVNTDTDRGHRKCPY